MKRKTSKYESLINLIGLWLLLSFLAMSACRTETKEPPHTIHVPTIAESMGHWPYEP